MMATIGLDGADSGALWFLIDSVIKQHTHQPVPSSFETVIPNPT